MTKDTLKYLSITLSLGLGSHVIQEINDQEKGETNEQGSNKRHSPSQLIRDGIASENKHNTKREGKNDKDDDIARVKLHGLDPFEGSHQLTPFILTVLKICFWKTAFSPVH